MSNAINVLSLFDGMACGMIAFKQAGINVNNYYAYEINKYAIQAATYNFPDIKECGDVFEADFTHYKDIDFLIGGSPCTYWSIAQSSDKRETTASGIGWELFSQYVRALREVKPKYFIYENNKSMSQAIRDSITKEFGFDAICINSALVSDQNRQRLYWVGKRNDNGTYSKINVEQPEDRGIILKDILNGITDKQKGRAVIGSTGRTTAREYFIKHQGNMALEPVSTVNGEKAFCLISRYYKGFGNNPGNPLEKHRDTMVAEPIIIGAASRGRYTKDGITEQHFEIRDDGKSNCITTVSKDSMICQQVGALPRPNGELSTSQGFRIYSIESKSVTLKGNAGGAGGKTGLYANGVQPRGYAEPCEWDENGIPIKAVSGCDGKSYTVYEVKNHQIAIKGKIYPINLYDGYYIIRKLTVDECKKLQTIPEWYEFPISDTQSYQCLGNGWTVNVIVHLINSCQ